MTTDTAAALRAMEIEADILLMAKFQVDGVYANDPRKDPTAMRYDFISYRDAMDQRLGVMDATALSLCREHQLPIVVFDLAVKESVVRIALGERIGSLVAEKAPVD